MRDRRVKPLFFAFIKFGFFSLPMALWIGLLSFAWEGENTDALETITKAELRDHIYYLASDYLEGRLAGSEGYKQASYYIASQLEAAGLAPVLLNANGKASYLQPMDFAVSTIAPESTLRIMKGRKEIAAVTGNQFIPLLHGQAFKDGHYEGEAVFVGYGIEEPEDGWNDYENLDVSGKIALMVTGTPMKDGKPVLSVEKNKLHGNFMDSARKRLLSALKRKAAGIIMVLDSSTAKMWSQLAPMLSRPTRRLQPDAKKEKTNFFPIFLLHPQAGVELLAETGFDPLTGKGEVKSAHLKDTTLVFDLKYNKERDFVCRNVVGFIQGSDPDLKDEYVVVGAHLDHLGAREEHIFNGADDNASGCSAILEAAEAMAMSPPRRSAFFVFFTAEEGSAQGSFHFIDNFPFSPADVALAINVDMVGRNCEPFPDSLFGISPDDLKRELAKFMETANKNIASAELKTLLDQGTPGDYYGGSDEVMFHMRGIPAVLITSGFSHPDYHKAGDDPDKINYDKVVAASRLIFALAVTAANADKPF